MAVTRTRNFMTIVYPDSCPENWRSILAECCVPAIVSPLHDKDKNADDTPKKAHWHVMLMFAGPKTTEQVQRICDKFGGIQCKPVSNTQSMARYFVHMDNPDKAQYDPDNIECYSGADWWEIVKTSRDRYDALAEITDFVHEKKMFSYSDLVRYCRLNNRRWFEVCCDNTVFLREFCKSGDWTERQKDVYQPHSVPNRSTQLDQT